MQSKKTSKKATKKTAKKLTAEVIDLRPLPVATRLEELAAKAPPRDKVNMTKLKAHLEEYVQVISRLEELEAEIEELSKKRANIAEEVVKQWGKGVIRFGDFHLLPASRNGVVVLRKMTAADGVVS